MAQSSGFEAFKRDNIALIANSQVDINIRLAVGGEVVEVGSPSGS